MSTTKTKKNSYAIHPGEVLEADFLQPLEISQYRLAKNIGVSPRRVNEIVHGTRSITADTALRLARFFGTSAQFWMNLQTHYDLTVSEKALRNSLDSAVQPLQVVAAAKAKVIKS